MSAERPVSGRTAARARNNGTNHPINRMTYTSMSCYWNQLKICIEVVLYCIYLPPKFELDHMRTNRATPLSNCFFKLSSFAHVCKTSIIFINSHPICFKFRQRIENVQGYLFANFNFIKDCLSYCSSSRRNFRPVILSLGIGVTNPWVATFAKLRHAAAEV